MTVTRDLCNGLKEQGKWVQDLCHLCRNRKKCKTSPEYKGKE